MKHLLKNYYLEILLASVVTFEFYQNLQVVPHQKWFVFAVGILAIIISILSKIDRDVKLSNVIDSFNERGKSEREKDNMLINEITSSRDKSEKRAQALEEQNNLITKLIKAGLITEESVYKIVQRYKFYYLFCYQNIPEQRDLEKSLGRSIRNPSLEAIESIGFVKVGTYSNFYIIPSDFLPNKMRAISKIEKIIRRLVNEHWDELLFELGKSRKKFIKGYLQRYPNIANCTYMVSESNFHDVTIDYIGYNAFSRKFKDILQYNIDIKKLKKEVSKKQYEINKFIQSISYDLFLEGILESDKKIFIDKELPIKRALGISRFTEYKDKLSTLKSELNKYFGKIKSDRYANVIVNKSKKYADLFELLGINLN